MTPSWSGSGWRTPPRPASACCGCPNTARMSIIRSSGSGACSRTRSRPTGCTAASTSWWPRRSASSPPPPSQLPHPATPPTRRLGRRPPEDHAILLLTCLVATPAAPSPFEYADIRVALVGLDESAGFITLRVCGYYTCESPCAGSDRIVFASLDQTEDEADRIPRAAAVLLSPTAPDVGQTLQLPVRGHALRYPFDSYELVLGVSLQRMDPDGRARPLSATEASNHWRLTLRDA